MKKSPIKKIPKHLKKFTLNQNYKLYTPMDQAGWRFIMRLSRDFFKDHAHPKYLSGLPATGISLEEIPRIEDMDACLKKLGWRAAVVSGFIPPAIFLEFLSLGILPVACDMRTFSHLHYTPAPDIVHEAAGHAPILADPEYANYIRRYGEVSQKVIFSAEDLAVYNAIRKLSDIKEDPRSTEKDIQLANEELEVASAANKTVSEATQLARMAWWTIEYGLVGSMEKPLIYGAGLLSSVGESYDCFIKNVKKVPFTLDCINVTYDITKPQPQLFVTPNFQHLVDVLEQFENTMAFKTGGKEALERARSARTVTTCQWSNGLQVSGVLESFVSDAWERPTLLIWKGRCQVSLNHREIKGYGPKVFSDGIGVISSPLKTPVNKLRAGPMHLEFESGIKLEGEYKGKIKPELGMVFEKARLSGGPLTKPVMIKNLLVSGTDKISSVFGEAADRASYYEVVSFMHEPNAIQKTNLTKENRELNKLYQTVRDIRSKKRLTEKDRQLLAAIGQKAEDYPEDWLLRMEILEILRERSPDDGIQSKIEEELNTISRRVPEHKDLISRGLSLL